MGNKEQIYVYSFGTQELLWSPKHPKELFWRQHIMVPGRTGEPERMALIMKVDAEISSFIETEELVLGEETIEKPIVQHYYVSYIIEDALVMKNMEANIETEVGEYEEPRVKPANLADLTNLTGK